MKLRLDYPEIVVFTGILLLLYGALATADGADFESPAGMNASAILDDDLLKGEHHRVDEAVRSDGYLNYYTIQSDFGEFEAVSTAMLKTRVGEINALAELDDLSKTEVFAKAAADAGIKQLKTVQEFATKPVATVKGIPKGIGRMFKRYSRQAGEAVDATQEFVAGDDEDSEDGDGEAGDDSNAAVDLTESYLGVGKAQRDWARKLGTDPYSSNEVLQAAIKDVAWAERLGRAGMGFAGVPKIPGADIIGDVNEAVWSKDSYELQDINRARLAATGAEEALIEAYLDNSRMSPSQQTLLTAAIAELEGVGGRDGILQQALNAKTEVEANFLIKSVSMLAWYHLNKKAIASVLVYAAVPVGLAEDGTTAFVFAVDHVYWTETIAEAASKHASRSKDSGAGVGEVWLLGTASNRTREELSRLGLTVHEEVAAMMVVPID